MSDLKIVMKHCQPFITDVSPPPPSFWSCRKEDYDLCRICFSSMGNVADYIRIDYPVSGRHPRPFKGMHVQVCSPSYVNFCFLSFFFLHVNLTYFF